jgi:hypothetical protein
MIWTETIRSTTPRSMVVAMMQLNESGVDLPKISIAG